MLRKIGLVCVLLIFLMNTISVCAADDTKIESGLNTTSICIVLGEDLSDTQKVKILQNLNNVEQEYSTTIVTKDEIQQETSDTTLQALLGVKLEKGETDSGIQINIENLQNLSSETLKNALLTIGMKDTEITIYAPFMMDGYEAFWYVVKGYSELTGDSLDENSVQTAWQEIELEKQLGTDSQTSDLVNQMITDLKAQIAQGQLASEEDMRLAIEQEQEKLGIELSIDQENHIVLLLKSLQTVGLTIGTLTTQAQDMYAEFGSDMIDHPDQALSSYIEEQITKFMTNFFQQLQEKMQEAWNNMLESIKS